MTVVVGIDLAAGRGITEVAALEVAESPGEDARPCFLWVAYRAVQRDEEIVAVTAATAPAVVAIDAPLSLPAAVMRALASPLAPLLAGEGRAVAHSPVSTGQGAASPYLRAAERDPVWGEVGVRPLPVSFLGGLTFRALVLLPQLRAALPDATVIEVFPSATHAILRGKAPATGQSAQRAKRQAKTTPAVRRQTQITLARWIEGIPTPPAADDAPDRRGVELLGADLLDALAAAYTAALWLYGHTLAAGDPSEGQMFLPDPQHFS